MLHFSRGNLKAQTPGNSGNELEVVMGKAINRRRFLRQSAVGVAAASTTAWSGCSVVGTGKSSMLDIIDCHTHFYDPGRPEGVPWPAKGSPLYRTVLPEHLRALPKPLPVTGTVIVEASSWVEDNQWLLDLAKNDPFVVGVVGHLQPGSDDYRRYVERFSDQELFRGLRVGEGLARASLENARVLADLNFLAEHDRALDVNGGPTTPLTVARLAEQAPDLRILINHIGNIKVDGKAVNANWYDGMREAAKHPNVFCKVSALVEGASRDRPRAPKAPSFYNQTLNAVWSAFGEDRVIFGSNWPVSERAADYATLLDIVLEYFSSKGSDAAKKFFALNAKRAYKWVERAGRLGSSVTV